MNRARIFLLLFLAAMLTGCSERAPRPDPEGEHIDKAEPRPSPMRERTLKQGESL